MAVVPEVAFCTKEAAVIAAIIVVVPTVLTERAASEWLAPTAPENHSLPEPEVMVKAYGVVEALSKVPLNQTGPLADPPLLELKVVSAPKVTLLPKVCRPEVVIVPPLIAVVPEDAF